MDEFIVIKVMNEAMLRLKKSKNEDCTKNTTINDFLKDEAFFFKIDKRRALTVLETVGVSKDKLNETYDKLTNINVYKKLINNGKIKPTDNLVVKYN